MSQGHHEYIVSDRVMLYFTKTRGFLPVGNGVIFSENMHHCNFSSDLPRENLGTLKMGKMTLLPMANSFLYRKMIENDLL